MRYVVYLRLVGALSNSSSDAWALGRSGPTRSLVKIAMRLVPTPPTTRAEIRKTDQPMSGFSKTHSSESCVLGRIHPRAKSKRAFVKKPCGEIRMVFAPRPWPRCTRALRRFVRRSGKGDFRSPVVT